MTRRSTNSSPVAGSDERQECLHLAVVFLGREKGKSGAFQDQDAELRPPNIAAWQALRQTLDYRQEGRRKQLRFRHDPQTYLASLEERLCRSSVPS